MYACAAILVLSGAVSFGSGDSQPAVPVPEIAKVFTTLYAVYDTAGIIERHRAEKGAIPRANGPAELSRAIFGDDAGAKYLVDPWGTPLHIESGPAGYLIVGAGSDRKFDRTTWTVRAATTTAADDVVLRDGELIRSPADWANTYIATARGLPASRDRLLDAGKHARTVSQLRALMSSILTYQAVEGRDLAVRDIEGLRRALVPKYANDVAAADGWGHSLFVGSDGSGKSFVIASAGPDGRFDKESWSNPTSATDDIILRADGSIRNSEPPPQKADAAGRETDRLLEAYASYMAALKRFQESRR